MDFTHCVGIDCGTSSIKIVVRDLEFDEVTPVRYLDGREVTIPSFVGVDEDGHVVVGKQYDLLDRRYWRFENLKGKILFQRDFAKQIADDLPLVCQLEGRDVPDSRWALNITYAQPHYELMLALKLAYLMRRVREDFDLQPGQILWSLPLLITSVESEEATAMRCCYKSAVEFSRREDTSKSLYSLSEYIELLSDYKSERSARIGIEISDLQMMPEGVCNIVAIVSASFRRTDRFSLIDVGASTIELITFSLEGQQLDIYHSKTSPLGIESLKSKGLATSHTDNQVELSDSASEQLMNEIVYSLVSPSSINNNYYKGNALVDVFMCGGGALVDSINQLPGAIPAKRLQSFGIISIASQANLAASAGYDNISESMLPRYLVACGLSIPAVNFSACKLPNELAAMFREISEMVILKPFSHLDDNWDPNAIK